MKEYSYICPECNGSGFIINLCLKYGIDFYCLLCGGYKKIYWTDIIKGIKLEKISVGTKIGPFKKISDNEWIYT